LRKIDDVTRCLKKSTKVYADQVALLEEYRESGKNRLEDGFSREKLPRNQTAGAKI
jgi:hypothetical protein